MADWNEQGLPNNNLGSTTYKKALSSNLKTDSGKQKGKQKKNEPR
ncbi:MAG: hypothetical protein ACQEUT_14700 [Bacillota bacterium]